MFKKMVAIERLNLTPEAENALSQYAEKVQFYYSIPEDNAAIIKRIGDADAVLLSYTSQIDSEVLDACPNIKYIGMCCSLYAPENANVDILTAEKKGIVVKGVRDYGDEGVPEYVISELVRLLHGFGGVMWKNTPMELTDINIGVMGMGTSGIMVARALKFFGANVYYFSRTRKPKVEDKEGFIWLPKDDLLEKAEILCTCLNKNVILMDERAFEIFGNGKIFVNTSIGPSHEIRALKKWLQNKKNYALSDTFGGLGSKEFSNYPNVFCPDKAAGTSALSKVRLSQKVIKNIEDYQEK
ncbi:D-isomer specific 2-hydroxyacid dehydrogenase family protein [Eubacterium sp. 1001713B170207_170306_E7]|uniref:D-isomer specific 2-hydroxyacid dehydrogenase family protein n=1 Tax=Eubacterium sp. 1001713B170207_170306_E7 TaxID=2787097 RepID=UPI00189AE16D|nr:D-isomer specific 2-hydroxyacid dehydrogenase family protein [Eubacterium sp. 1001713B170207_170306_E7]